jgi:hypothetical protein
MPPKIDVPAEIAPPINAGGINHPLVYNIAMPPPLSLPPRISWKRDTNCWVWNGANINGYGRMYFQGKQRFSSHVSAHLFLGFKFPENSQSVYICHRCDNPRCVNPAHLFIGTPTDNVQDAIAKGRRYEQPRLKQCQRGHAFTPENTYIKPNGRRNCKACLKLAALRNH